MEKAVGARACVCVCVVDEFCSVIGSVCKHHCCQLKLVKLHTHTHTVIDKAQQDVQSLVLK